MSAYLMTKALAAPRLEELRTRIGLKKMTVVPDGGVLETRFEEDGTALLHYASLCILMRGQHAILYLSKAVGFEKQINTLCCFCYYGRCSRSLQVGLSVAGH